MINTYEEEGGDVRLSGKALTMADASASLPHGAYTTLRTYGGNRVVRLGDHARRLEDSGRSHGQPGALPQERLRRAVAGALADTRHAESRLRVTFAPPRLFVSVEPFAPLPPAFYRDGVACITVQVRRERPGAKDTRFIAEAGRAYGLLPRGVHEGLMVADDGSILEGLSSNFFAVLDGQLHTEEARALPGVTRAMVLELAARVVPVARAAVRKQELSAVSECFLTSASRGVLPAVTIDAAAIGVGRPGPLTRELMRGFEELVEREAMSVLA